MLRCAGCDGLVSEFAARCPVCRHDTDDAVDVGHEPHRAMVDLPPGPRPEESPYTADPAESPGSEKSGQARPGRRPGLVAVGIVIVVASAILVGQGSPGSTQRPRAPGLPAWVRALKGHIVADDQDGTLLQSLPDGTHPTVLRPGPGKRAGRPVPATFVAVAAPRQLGGGPPTGINGLADSEVDLRDHGRPSAVLATAAQLNRDVHQNPDLAVNLSVFPDRDGGKVAVVVNPIGAGESNSPMVILDRHGRLLDAIGPGRGPSEYTTPYWSPDDTSLAYATFGSVGTSLAMMNRSYHIVAQALQPGSSIGACAWSPDSAWVACLATSPSANGWLLARNDDTLTPIDTVPARGTPLLWLP